MKWILAILLFVSGTAIGQSDDTDKYIWYKYQYGSRMPRFWADSVLKAAGLVKFTGLVAKTDTTANKPIVIDAAGNVHKMVGWPGSTGISDTTNKWMNDLRRRSGTDTVEKFKNGSWQFAYKDSTGGGGATLSNIGSGYRLVKTAGGQIKTEFAGYGIIKDSTTNTDGITDKADTSSTNHLVTQSDLNDAASAVTLQSQQSIIGDGSSGNKFRMVNDVTIPNKGDVYIARVGKDSSRQWYPSDETFRGIISNVTNWASSTTGITNSAVTVGLSGGNLHVTGGSVYGTLSFDSLVTDITKYEIEDTVIIIEKSATSYGNGIGTHGINPVSGHAVDVALRFDASTGGTSGHLILTKGTAHNTTTSDNAISFNSGDTVVLKLSRDNFTLAGTGRNITQNSVPVPVSYTFVPATDADLMPNLGKFCIHHYGGEYTISSLKITSNYSKNCRLLLEADSRYAYQVTTEAESLGSLLNNNFKSTIVVAGGFDRAQEHLFVLPEIASYSPQQSVICLGYNDIADGGSSLGTTEGYLDSIYHYHTNHNIDAYFLLAPTKSPATSMTSLNAYLRSTYPGKVIDVEQLLLANGALAADGVHWTPYGVQLIIDYIIRNNILWGGNTRYGAAGGGSVSGTANTIAMFTGPGSLGNSPLSTDGIRVTNTQMLEMSNTAPDIVLTETDAGTDEKRFTFNSNNGILSIRGANDARNDSRDYMLFGPRSGMDITRIRSIYPHRFEGGIQLFNAATGSSGDSDVVYTTGTGDLKIVAPRATRAALSDTAAALRTLIGGGADGNGIYSGSNSLSGPTTITGAGNALTLTGTQAAAAAFTISNTGNGQALATSASGSGISLSSNNSGSGTSIFGSANSGTGGYFTSTSGLPLYAAANPSSTNSIVNTFMTGRSTSSTAAAGLGTSWDMQNEDDAGNLLTTFSQRSVLTSAATGAVSADYQIWTINSGSLAQKFTIKPAGQMKFNTYGSGTHTGTVVSFLATTSDGSVIETSTATGSIVVMNDADHTVTGTESAIRYHNTITGNRTVTIPDPSAATNREIWIKWNTINGGSSLNITTTTGTALIYLDGTASSATYNITTSNRCFLLKSDGTSWYSVGGSN